MAVIVASNETNANGTYTVKLWETVTENDTCTPVDMGEFPDRSVQVTGTFGGAAINIEGSNDGGTNWFTLNDLQGTPLSFTVAGLKGIAELVDKIRPNPSGGSSTDIDVRILFGGRYK